MAIKSLTFHAELAGLQAKKLAPLGLWGSPREVGRKDTAREVGMKTGESELAQRKLEVAPREEIQLRKKIPSPSPTMLLGELSRVQVVKPPTPTPTPTPTSTMGAENG